MRRTGDGVPHDERPRRRGLPGLRRVTVLLSRGTRDLALRLLQRTLVGHRSLPSNRSGSNSVPAERPQPGGEDGKKAGNDGQVTQNPSQQYKRISGWIIVTGGLVGRAADSTVTGKAQYFIDARTIGEIIMSFRSIILKKIFTNTSFFLIGLKLNHHICSINLANHYEIKKSTRFCVYKFRISII